MGGKFGRQGQTVPQGQVRTIATSPDDWTYEGGAGYSRDAKSELYLLAVNNMVSEDTFYESGKDRDERYIRLIHQVCAEDPTWVARFVPFLRDEMHLRSASIMMAAEYARALNGQNDLVIPIRKVVARACQRADEPGEMLAYWIGRYGRNVPKGVKRGVADAATRLYNQHSAIKYNGADRIWRPGDVIELVHPKAKHEEQAEVFHYLLDTRHHPDDLRLDWDKVPVLKANQNLRRELSLEARAALLKEPNAATVLAEAGFTWEMLSGWLQSEMDATAWQAIIPSMGYMALLRNLRNFDQADVNDAVKQTIKDKLADPEEVAKSRQLPFRFYSAWANAPSMEWGSVLEKALQLSLQNVPEFGGRTLVLIDVSGSMRSPMSRKSTVMAYVAAGLFGGAVASRSEDANLVCFGTRNMDIGYTKSEAILRVIDRVDETHKRGHLDYGTNIWQAYQAHYNGHDRTLIFTDEQGHDSYGYDTRNPVYIFNVGGYRIATAPSGGNVHSFGGLSDGAFIGLSMLERHQAVGWPFEHVAY